MRWYEELNQAIAKLFDSPQTMEVKTLLSVLVEPTHGPEQQLAVQMTKEL